MTAKAYAPLATCSDPPCGELLCRIHTPAWSGRIPAAITKAEELLDGEPDWMRLNGDIPVAVLTATELALAKALWESVQTDLSDHIQEYCGGEPECVAEHDEFTLLPALIAFTEKVESL